MADHITVCVCTYRRNALLARLLRNLALQRTDGLFTFSVVVVDNDPEGPARAEVERLGPGSPLDVIYGVEPRKGIPFARNHALGLAKGPFIAIIDDDEIPPPHWLRTLYEAVRTFDVDGALGPVVPFFDQAPPDWLIKSRLSDLPRRRTGTRLRWDQCYTGNVLLKKDVFDRDSLRFDEAFRTGGSDQAFFRQAMDAGFRFVAVDEAPVYEVILPERWDKAYFVRRALVNGYNAHKYSVREGRGPKTAASLVKSAVALLAFAVSAPVTRILGAHVWVERLEGAAYHLSRLAAAAGIEMRKTRDF